MNRHKGDHRATVELNRLADLALLLPVFRTERIELQVRFSVDDERTEAHRSSPCMHFRFALYELRAILLTSAIARQAMRSNGESGSRLR